MVIAHHRYMVQQALSLTFDAKPHPGAPRRFSAVAYSGGLIPSYGHFGDVAIDLGSLRNADGEVLPVLIDHDQRIDAIAGKGRIYRATGDDGLPYLALDGELSDATEAGRRIAALLAEGYPVQLSVGMSATVREIVAGSEPIEVNGRALKLSAVFEGALVREVSFVAVGADPATRAHAFAAHIHQENLSMTDATQTAPAGDDVGALKARIAELEAEIQSMREDRRKAELAALFEAVGRDAPDDITPYLEMSDKAFAAFAADLKALAKPARDAALFTAASVVKAGEGGANHKDAARRRMDALMSAIKQITV